MKNRNSLEAMLLMLYGSNSDKPEVGDIIEVVNEWLEENSMGSYDAYDDYEVRKAGCNLVNSECERIYYIRAIADLKRKVKMEV